MLGIVDDYISSKEISIKNCLGDVSSIDWQFNLEEDLVCKVCATIHIKDNTKYSYLFKNMGDCIVHIISIEYKDFPQMSAVDLDNSSCLSPDDTYSCWNSYKRR